MKYLLAVLFAITTTQSFAQVLDARAILRQMKQAMESHQSLSYEVSYDFKGSNRADTVSYRQLVHLMRVPEDSIFGGMVWMGQFDRSATCEFYDLYNIFRMDRLKIAAWTKDPHKMLKAARKFSALNDFMIWTPFLRTTEIQELAQPANTTQLLKDTVINGKDCYQLLINSPKTTLNTPQEWKMLLCIYKKDLVPIYRKVLRWNNGKYQHENFVFNFYSFDTVDESRFSSSQIPQFFIVREEKQ
jgi:hypothetical protein